MKKTWIIIIAVIAVIAVYGISSYNSMVSQEEAVGTAWSNVENQYQRRADLIPNLVNTVKGYAAHEKETFDAVGVSPVPKATPDNGKHRRSDSRKRWKHISVHKVK